VRRKTYKGALMERKQLCTILDDKKSSADAFCAMAFCYAGNGNGFGNDFIAVLFFYDVYLNNFIEQACFFAIYGWRFVS
jgi:hypothetical protein